ncbi:MAG: hypothetical protein ACI9M3_001918, partial [Bacteroidia bacterium]
TRVLVGSGVVPVVSSDPQEVSSAVPILSATASVNSVFFIVFFFL